MRGRGADQHTPVTRPYVHTHANDPDGLIWYETRPRHLAGPGDPRRITQTLRAAGWTNLSTPDYPHVVLASPDQQLTLVLEPQPGQYGSWWRLRSQQECWTAEFGANTPVEMIAALTDALLEPEPAASTPEIWPMLTTAGWRYERGEHANESATHPDGRLRLRRWSVEPLLDRFYWTAEAAREFEHAGPFGPLWRAWLDDDMPRHLLAAFVNALVCDEPVQRSRGDVPHNYLVTQEERGPQSDQLAADHEARLKAVRAATRKARRAATRATRTAPPLTPEAPAAPAPVHPPAARR
ncbi:DUF317 domain-containing protein [Streptomyces murinus]|uniref:DUF317 domain-containing protein n=1 Tax=Streptomyces murinus TaxID=33900 RepID=UPI003809A4B3